VRLLGADTDALVFSGGEARFPRREGWSLSVFALSDACGGVTIRGTVYECENVTLTNAFPLGVSNVWASEEAVVSAESGILLVIQSKLKEGEHI
jgi:thiamine pyrophosphokinase